MTAPHKWLWLQEVFGIATDRAERVLSEFGSPDEILSLRTSQILSYPGFSEQERRALLSPEFAQAKEKIKITLDCGFTPITPDMPQYPALLREIHKMPLILYAKGDISLLSECYPITMVGTRSTDEYGRRAAKKLATEIAGGGGVVVSGLARGIDAVCHESALAVGGKTIAVLACGADGKYPSETLSLREEIEKHALVLTEFPPGTIAKKYTFHIRNRILSGLSLATVIIQAGETSGALITAGYAAEQDRDVYAVPGDMFSLKMGGCHALLSEGASAIFSGGELLRHYEAIYRVPLRPVCGKNKIAALANPQEIEINDEPERKPRKISVSQKNMANIKHEDAAARKNTPAAPAMLAALPQTQQKIYAACEHEISFDELCEETGIPAAELLSALTQLEIFGLVAQMPGRRFRRF